MNFKFVLPCIFHINFGIQTKFKVNQTQIGHSIPQKLTKVTIKSQLLHFSMNFSETFRINVNVDFAHILLTWPIFDLGLQKNFEPKIPKKPGLF